jgi:high-affinity iron transporter
MTVPASNLFDFAMITIFAREFLEGAIIIGEYRTVVLRSDSAVSLAPGVTKDDALSTITIATCGAIAFALFVIACVAIPLAILSSTFEPDTAYIIEGVSKIVAAISLLQLSLKVPTLLGIYGSSNSMSRSEGHENRLDTEHEQQRLTLRSIRFNVAWNIWREVAEIGVFLVPSLLSHTDLLRLPCSGLIGALVGTFVGVGIFIANQRFANRKHLCIFIVLLLVVLSAGLYTGGSHKLEIVLGSTEEVWSIDGAFWSIDRLPMTIIKPFGYRDSRTVLEIVSYWSWLLLSSVLHYRKLSISLLVPVGETVAGTSLDVADSSDEERADDDASKGYRTVDETLQSSNTSNPSL